MPKSAAEKLVVRRVRDRARARELRAERPAVHPRLAQRPAKERTVKCGACGSYKHFDVDAQGRGLEICRCGVAFIGA